MRRYKSLPNAEKLKFGQIITAVWIFELTKSSEGYHPHWHGIVLAQIPKVLLTALWKMATKGEAYITHIRKVSSPAEAIEYVEDYVSDGFIDLGDDEEENKKRGQGGVPHKADKEELIEIEEALHGRRKVRAWGFDLMKGQQFGQQASDTYVWVHSYSIKFHLLKESRKTNLHDYWRMYWKARELNKEQPYIVVEMEHSDYYFGRRLILLGFLTPEGLIKLEPVNISDMEIWQDFIEALFDYGGNVNELMKAPSDDGYGSVNYEIDISL